MKRSGRAITNIFNRYIKSIKIPFDSLFALIGLLLLCIFLVRNIYLNIDIWLTNYQLKEEKTVQLEEIKTENDRLNKAVEYYKSSFYQRKYARESLNLAKPNQKLFLVERKQEYEFLQEQNVVQEVQLTNNREWWLKLLL
ncbi:hypothetical protein KBD45_05180 [Candidatus Dojkabacteria bacterium]|nr:hypothetical protein [Candidatus Dojkabacteria bacterium]